MWHIDIVSNSGKIVPVSTGLTLNPHAADREFKTACA